MLYNYTGKLRPCRCRMIEEVNGKTGRGNEFSIMPGDGEWQKFGNAPTARCGGIPGARNYRFMGNEFAQGREYETDAVLARLASV